MDHNDQNEKDQLKALVSSLIQRIEMLEVKLLANEPLPANVSLQEFSPIGHPVPGRILSSGPLQPAVINGGRFGGVSSSGPIQPAINNGGRGVVGVDSPPFTPNRLPPTAPRAMRGQIFTPTSARGGGPATPDTRMFYVTGRRHKRTETPEQLHLKSISGGVKFYTMGLLPQEDRGLLTDFFENIGSWCYKFIAEVNINNFNQDVYTDLQAILGDKSDPHQMLRDKNMSQDVAMALVVRDVVQLTLQESALLNSDHPAAAKAASLITAFEMQSPEDFAAKHELCYEQKALYKSIYDDPGHKKWRTGKADEYARLFVKKMKPFLQADASAEVAADREHLLSELYVKGYRIGFRLRSDLVKWQVTWPVAGINFNADHMVNQTRNLAGDPMSTMMELEHHNARYFVRFAMTPTIIKYDYSEYSETKTVVHSALVHVGRVGVYSHVADRNMGNQGLSHGLPVMGYPQWGYTRWG